MVRFARSGHISPRSSYRKFHTSWILIFRDAAVTWAKFTERENSYKLVCIPSVPGSWFLYVLYWLWSRIKLVNYRLKYFISITAAPHDIGNKINSVFVSYFFILFENGAVEKRASCCEEIMHTPSFALSSLVCNYSTYRYIICSVAPYLLTYSCYITYIYIESFSFLTESKWKSHNILITP